MNQATGVGTVTLVRPRGDDAGAPPPPETTTPFGAVEILAAACVAAGVAIAAGVLLRGRVTRPGDNGERALGAMARGLRLSRRERGLVRSLAVAAKINPASLLLSRGAFDHAASLAATGSGPEAARAALAVAAVRAKVFGEN